MTVTIMIHFNCPRCGNAIKVKDEIAGRRGKCRGCGETIQVPSADAAAQDEPAGLSTATWIVMGVCGGVCVPLIIGLIAWFICHTQPQHGERTPEQEKAAVDFSFEGVGFSTTLADS